MEIRPIKLKDLVKVRDLEIDCIREYFSQILENRWEDFPEEWKDNLGASNRRSYQLYLGTGLSFVAEEDGEVMGFIFAQMLHGVAGMESPVWIENMGVHKYFRRMGLGRQLLEKVVETARAMGATAVHSTIPQDNLPSIGLHEKLGFVTDRRESALLDLYDLKIGVRRGSDYIVPMDADIWDRLPDEWKAGVCASFPDARSIYPASGYSFASVRDGEIMGCIFAQVLHHVNNVADLVWIEDIFVSEDYRRMGLGFKLLRKVAETAKNNGSTAVQSMIPSKNVPAIMLFKKIGFFIDRRISAVLRF